MPTPNPEPENKQAGVYVTHKYQRKPRGEQLCLGNFMVERPCLLIFIIFAVVVFLYYIFATDTLLDFNIYLHSSPKQFVDRDAERVIDWKRQEAAEDLIYEMNFIEGGRRDKTKVPLQSHFEEDAHIYLVYRSLN